jgi:enoyl-CoA hydratase/carnithine racemase
MEEMVKPVISELADGCALIRLSCGDANALTTDVLRSVSKAIDDAEKTARGIMLCGGDKFFSNGVDLEWALSQSRAEIRMMFLELGAGILKLLESPLPIVGVAKGHAIGGALAMLLACDYRYAALGRVLLGKPEILLGVPNPYYGDQLLRFVAGDYIASDLIYTGKLVTAEDARALNLVHEVGEKSDIEIAATRRLHDLIDLVPEAFSESKRMRVGKLCADIRDQMSARVARQVETWSSDDAQARLRAAAERLAR